MHDLGLFRSHTKKKSDIQQKITDLDRQFDLGIYSIKHFLVSQHLFKINCSCPTNKLLLFVFIPYTYTYSHDFRRNGQKLNITT